MRAPFGFAIAAVGAALCALAPAATALDGSPVSLNQTVQRTEGHCQYTATFRGHYRALPADSAGNVHVRDAVVDVDARVQCRGQAPQSTLQEVYFAGATERELLDRLEEVARMDHQARRTACAFMPAIHRTDAGHIESSEVRVECHARVHDHTIAAR